jgi:uncharacterized protein YdhG (YjbR/CyaY superfamily)
MKNKTPRNIDEYIKKYPEEIQKILQNIRATVRKSAPNAEETICYQIPTFKMEKNLVHFAAFTKHIGFFPTSSGVTRFKKELKAFKTSKGTIQFPLDKPIPYGLISKITKFRVNETIQKRGKR